MVLLFSASCWSQPYLAAICGSAGSISRILCSASLLLTSSKLFCTYSFKEAAPFPDLLLDIRFTRGDEFAMNFAELRRNIRRVFLPNFREALPSRHFGV